MPYKSKQEAVNALRPGWRVTGESANMVKVPNPDAGRAGQPAEIQEQQGSILTIDDPTNPNNPPDTVVIKEVGNAPWKGGVGYDVVQGPTKALPEPTRKPTASGQLDKLNANGDPLPAGSTEKPSFVRDPATGSTFQVDATVPTDPSSWTKVTNPNDPNEVIGLWDPKNNKMAATVPQGAQGNKRTGEYTDLIDPNDPNKKRVIGKVDTGTKEIFSVSRDPNINKQVVTTPNAVYTLDENGKPQKILDVEKDSPFQAVSVDGKPFTFDPNTGKFTAGPTSHPDITVGEARTPMVWQEDGEGNGKYVYPPGVTVPKQLTGVGTTSPNLVWYDSTTGEEIKRATNPNYQQPQTTQGAQSTTAPMIQQWNPKTAQWEWVENKGRVTASEALRNMASQLSGQVVAGDISVDEAKTMIESANAKMTADAQRAQTAGRAAGDILTATGNAAQTGAGLLNQRVQSATGALNQVVSQLGSGNLMGGLPSGWGARLTGGLKEWVTDLGGGQPVYDSAAAMVNTANPTISGDPTTAQQAYAALRGMMDLYKANTGEPHPLDKPTQTPITAPNTAGGFNQNDLQWNQPANAANVAGRTMVPGGAVVGPQTPAAVPPPPPVPVAPVNQVAGQNYGAATAYTGGVPPWLAQPGAAIPQLPIPQYPFRGPVTV